MAIWTSIWMRLTNNERSWMEGPACRGLFISMAVKQGLQIGAGLVRCGSLLVRKSICVNKTN